MPWLGVWIGVAYWNAMAATRGASHGFVVDRSKPKLPAWLRRLKDSGFWLPARRR